MPNLLQLQPGENVQTIIDTRDYETMRYLFFTTKQGQVKKTKFNEYDSSLRTGMLAINLRDGVELVKVIPTNGRSEEHTSELQSLMRPSYAVFCLTTQNTHNQHRQVIHRLPS